MNHSDPVKAAFARLTAALAEARANGDAAQIVKAQRLIDQASLEAVKGRLAKAAPAFQYNDLKSTPEAKGASRVIPGTKTIQSPAVDDEPEPDEVDDALRAAQEQLAQANGSGSPASIAKAQRDLDAATIAAIRSRHTEARTKGTNR